MNTQFRREVLRQLEACDKMNHLCEDVILTGSHAEGYLKLDLTTFKVLCEHTQLDFPKVVLGCPCAQFVWELTGKRQCRESVDYWLILTDPASPEQKNEK